MNFSSALSSPEVQAAARDVAKNGSPALIGAAGRLLGLGEPEQTALSNGKVPGWFWAVTGVALGVVVGVNVAKRWPRKVPEFLVLKIGE